MSSRFAHLNPVPWVAAGTRRLQAWQPRRPLKGLTRFSNLLHRWLPSYQGIIRLPNGVRMAVDSNQPADRWMLFAGNYQPALTHVLQRHTSPGDYCLDGGANLGYYTLQFAHWAGPQGRVLAFEANPAMVERIAHNVALNDFSQVAIVSQPIHRQSEEVTFYVASYPGKSSIYAAQVTDPVRELTLMATTIDAALQEREWPRLDVVKLDIEGNDCHALLGAQESLARFRPFLVFEFRYTTPTEIAQETAALLGDLGYTLRGLWPNGRQTPFAWQPPEVNSPARHIDVIGQPDQK